MDSIEIKGIRSYGYTGYLQEERVLGQWFEVNVRLWFDLRVAGHSDTIADTVDYRGTIATVEHIVKTAKFALVERLAEAIAQAILEQSQVERVQIQLIKLAPPFLTLADKFKLKSLDLNIHHRN
ncbi:dihydroneopterin aldolase [Limnospira platensis C1]|nr:dihydroneopterin aldolase [Arthrospira platensis C1]